MNKFRGILIASSILTVLTASSSVWVERKDFPIVKAAEFLECTHVGLQRVPDFGIPTLSLGHQYMTISFVFPPLSNYAKIEGLLGIYEGKVIVQAIQTNAKSLRIFNGS